MVLVSPAKWRLVLVGLPPDFPTFELGAVLPPVLKLGLVAVLPDFLTIEFV
jgi:hypothetical protein